MPGALWLIQVGALGVFVRGFGKNCTSDIDLWCIHCWVVNVVSEKN